MNKNVFLLLAWNRPRPGRLHDGPEIRPARGSGPGRMAHRSGLCERAGRQHTPQKLRTCAWQEFFTDEKLHKLIEMALTNNRDLRLAALNVERARALYGIQRAELLPTVDATASGSQQRLPADLSPTGSRATVEQYGVNLGVASWEIDFFGRIRSLKDRALEEYLATEQARRSAQILLVSSVAKAYLALAADRENLALAQNHACGTAGRL